MEEKIKNQLEKRHIEPSKHLWAELENTLDKADTNSQKKYWWIGIAASFFIGGLITYAIVFHSSNQKKQYTPNFALNTTLSKVKKPTINPPLSQQTSVRTASTISTDKESVTQQNTKKISITPKGITHQLVPVTFNQLASISPEKIKVESTISKQTQATTTQATTEKKTDIQTKKPLSEADKLLIEAQKEISYQSVLDDTKNEVNPDILLHESHLKESNSISDFLKKSVQKRIKIVAEN